MRLKQGKCSKETGVMFCWGKSCTKGNVVIRVRVRRQQLIGIVTLYSTVNCTVLYCTALSTNPHAQYSSKFDCSAILLHDRLRHVLPFEMATYSTLIFTVCNNSARSFSLARSLALSPPAFTSLLIFSTFCAVLYLPCTQR